MLYPVEASLHARHIICAGKGGLAMLRVEDPLLLPLAVRTGLIIWLLSLELPLLMLLLRLRLNGETICVRSTSDIDDFLAIGGAR